MPVISGSSPLIALVQLNQFDLLKKIFTTILIPPAVGRETVRSVRLPAWISQRALALPIRPQIGAAALGDGETEAISLALEIANSTVLLDDLAARRLAQAVGVPAMGTVGLLLLGKQRGHVSAIRPYLDALLAAGFFIGPSLLEQALADAGER